jgi:exodeoxyribonuclease VII small subunit
VTQSNRAIPSPEALRPTASNPDAGETAFESALARLSDIVERLERGELPLEESLGLFEEGIRLARTAQTRLDTAERRVEELLGFDEQGNPVVRKLGGDSE